MSTTTTCETNNVNDRGSSKVEYSCTMHLLHLPRLDNLRNVIHAFAEYADIYVPVYINGFPATRNMIPIQLPTAPAILFQNAGEARGRTLLNVLRHPPCSVSGAKFIGWCFDYFNDALLRMR